MIEVSVFTENTAELLGPKVTPVALVKPHPVTVTA